MRDLRALNGRVALSSPIRGERGGEQTFGRGRSRLSSGPVGSNRKGVAMKRIVVMVCAVIGLALSSGNCHASWGAVFYSGYQPWFNIFAKRYKCMTPEEERLQKFWHDYYHAMKDFYCSLDHI